ncbi:MAG: Uma2 family endonuclease [Solirubrobacteraceae bacterium]
MALALFSAVAVDWPSPRPPGSRSSLGRVDGGIDTSAWKHRAEGRRPGRGAARSARRIGRVAIEELEHVHRLSVDEYRRLVQAEVFDEDAPLELIEGLLLDMSPKTPAHENAVEWLNGWLSANAPRGWSVRVSSPLSLAASEPEPDLALIAPETPRPFHPSTAALVIEVAVSSLRRDLERKPAVYARAGIPDYWVVDLSARCIVVHRNTNGDRYTSIQTVAATGRVACRSLPDLPVDQLLAAARG